MKTVKIADLKAHLSSYLRDVRAGGELVVADRSTPFAVISPLRKSSRLPGIRKATLSPAAMRRIRPVPPLKPVDPLETLLEDRNARW